MEKKDSLVSVIVPIYNVEKYLQKCLVSIQKQIYTNLEVILVNDGSTDHSGHIAQEFALKDNRFIYIEKKNGGLSSARNEGMRLATGEFLSFVDSDDWIKENYIGDMVSEFEESVDIVIGKYTLVDRMVRKTYVPYSNEVITQVFSGEEKEREIIERHLNAYPGKGFLIKDTLMPVWKNMYRRKLLTMNTIFFVSERDVGAEDYVFNFEAYYFAEKIKFSVVAGYVHEIVTESLSRRYYADALKRELHRGEYIVSLASSKRFYHRDNIFKAIADEKCRMVLSCIYGICRADIIGKREKVERI